MVSDVQYFEIEKKFVVLIVMRDIMNQWFLACKGEQYKWKW